MNKIIQLEVPDNAYLICNYVYQEDTNNMVIGQLTLGDEDIKDGDTYNIETLEDSDTIINELQEIIDEAIELIENIPEIPNNYLELKRNTLLEILKRRK